MRKPVFRGTKPLALTGVLLALSTILLAACGGSPSTLDPAGPIAGRESNVFWLLLIIAAIIFVGVEGMLIYSIFRFRERPDSPPAPQWHGNLKVEIIWTVLPAILLGVILFITIQGLFDVAKEPEGKTVEVTAYGHQWWWEFYYPDSKITTADSLVVPPNTWVKVKLFSNNVIHSFWVPQLTGKTDVVPGHDNVRTFKADKPGRYTGICAEYCGVQHANMRFDVVVTDNFDKFQTWQREQQAAAANPASDLQAKGKQLYLDQCTTCHGIVGVLENYTGKEDPTVQCVNPEKQNGCLIGPDLTHFGSRKLIAGGVLENNVDQCQPGGDLSNCNLAKWLQDPQKVKPGNDMVIGQLSKDDIAALVAYLESLK
uniref:Cytochrome c oxidase subunit 2 n=1 Tax=Thermosporothrix sp. COM3 TaxID=2490863 RepID=A0A455STJ6_9CHLR|nr:cytochrome c oxidase subunit II [Thermosporothrix sp. COM3]